jgi:glycosyltransferase involved in cell wall biosynthesis
MKIAIVTDAWSPQVNGVVTTLTRTRDTLTALGHEVLVVQPGDFRTFPCPTYPEIRLAWRPYAGIRNRLEAFGPERIHIATEGPLGLAARTWCRRRRYAFTTSFHTQFAEYVRARAPVPLAVSYAFLRWFHGGAARTMVATASQRAALQARGFGNLAPWTRGVDTALFRPDRAQPFDGKRPAWIYVGRVAVEKSIEDFLRLDLPGTKIVVGDGPERAALERAYPAVRFTGYRFGEALAATLAACDVFVFPSRTDTFGVVMLEAMACGLPVAAYPVTGPADVVEPGVTGVLDRDLRRAALAALELDRGRCRDAALRCSWEEATRQFLANLEPVAAVYRDPRDVAVIKRTTG